MHASWQMANDNYELRLEFEGQEVDIHNIHALFVRNHR
jgi:hypothetical protein